MTTTPSGQSVVISVGEGATPVPQHLPVITRSSQGLLSIKPSCLEIVSSMGLTRSALTCTFNDKTSLWPPNSMSKMSDLVCVLSSPDILL